MSNFFPGNKKEMCLLFFLTLIALTPLAIIAKYNQPLYDDFITGSKVIEYGRLGAVKYFYFNVSGRYISILLNCLFTSLPNYSAISYKYFPLLIIVIIPVSFFIFFKRTLLPFFSKTLILKITIVSALLYIFSMQSLFEGIYWMSATASYQFALSFLLLGTAILIQSHFQKEKSFFLAFLCSFALCGTSESFAITYLCIHSTYLIWYFKSTGKFNIINIVCIISCMAGLIVVLIAPGNWHRVSINTEAGHDILYALFRAILAIGYYSIKWYFSLAFLGFLMLFFYWYKKNEIFFGKLMKRVLILPFYYWLLSATVICITFYMPYLFLQNDTPSWRLTNIQFIFVTSAILFILLFIFTKSGKDSFVKKLKPGKKFLLVAWTCFFIGIFFSKNYQLVIKELSNKTAYIYDKQCNQRFERLQKCASDTCYVPIIKNYSLVLASMQEHTNSHSYFPYDQIWHKAIIIKDDKIQQPY